MKFKIYFFLFFLNFSFGVAQIVTPEPSAIDSSFIYGEDEYVTSDSSLKKIRMTNEVVFPKKFEEKFQSKYKGEEFDYTTIKPRESLWEKMRKKIAEIMRSIFGEVDPLKSANYAEIILRFFAIVIIGLVIYFLLKFLLNKDGNFFFGKKNKKLNISDQDLKENIHEINFPDSINNFERKKDHRSAIRYQFLFVLKKLSDKKLIDWNPEKTNKDYLAELNNKNQKADFKELVYIFNNVWYGEFEVDDQSYVRFKEKFNRFQF